MAWSMVLVALALALRTFEANKVGSNIGAPTRESIRNANLSPFWNLTVLTL